MDTSDQAKLLPHMVWAGAGILLLAIAAVVWFGRREQVAEAEPAPRRILPLAGWGIALLGLFAALTFAISSPALEAADMAVAAAARGWGGTLATQVMAEVSTVDAAAGSFW